MINEEYQMFNLDVMLRASKCCFKGRTVELLHHFNPIAIKAF